MKILSTNIGVPTTIIWNNKEVKTGIYKYPVNEPIYLEKEDVKKDHVMDRRVHGGVDKACYMYSADHYPFWKEKYPDLKWDYGMFGENLTVKELDESIVKIGSIYSVGTAIVQISQPRQPCYKLGVRFKTQKMVKDFVLGKYPGVYLRVLEPGEVREGDVLTIKEEHINGITILEMYALLLHKNNTRELIKKAIDDPYITTNNKVSILNKFGSNI
ncbi:MOSC domain-containing protein [Aquimarina sp. 2201CG1-2-11]|uniref:MOSC domain-containing protein n=1 Tax=Aquimarina discodermiae TaxID=3231043 RepID=UPI00346277D6